MNFGMTTSSPAFASSLGRGPDGLDTVQSNRIRRGGGIGVGVALSPFMRDWNQYDSSIGARMTTSVA